MGMPWSKCRPESIGAELLGQRAGGGSRGHDGVKHQQIFFSCQNKEDFFDKREQTEGLLSSAVFYCSWKSMTALQL